MEKTYRITFYLLDGTKMPLKVDATSPVQGIKRLLRINAFCTFEQVHLQKINEQEIQINKLGINMCYAIVELLPDMAKRCYKVTVENQNLLSVPKWVNLSRFNCL
jgi:hypothetical protein